VLVSTPFLSNSFNVVVRQVHQKISPLSKGHSSAKAEKIEMREMIELCPYVYEFPTLGLRVNSDS
jgi:hypothetical protein